MPHTKCRPPCLLPDHTVELLINRLVTCLTIPSAVYKCVWKFDLEAHSWCNKKQGACKQFSDLMLIYVATVISRGLHLCVGVFRQKTASIHTVAVKAHLTMSAA